MTIKEILVEDKKSSEGCWHRLYINVFMRFLRKAKYSKFKFIRFIYKVLFRIHSSRHGIEMQTSTEIGPGFCVIHPYSITIASGAIIGKKVYVCKGALIAVEHRGIRMGAPIIGNNVFVGVNAIIVGKVKIGNDVLIAPCSFVNRDIPDHSVVFGNPCVIKHKENATEEYIK